MKFFEYTDKTVKQVLADFGVSLETGLASGEIKKRLEQYGPNEIKEREVTWWGILIRQIRSAFIYLLLFASLVAFFLGEHLNAFLILIFVIINALLGFFQEYRSQKSVKLLKKYVVSKALVLREGKKIFVESANLVPGDIVFLEQGDMVPADLRVVQENNLMVDESIITGESAPVRKSAAEMVSAAQSIYAAQNVCFTGSTIASGSCSGVVINTGRQTEVGKIAKAVAGAASVGRFEKDISKFSRFILRMVVITVVFVFLANVFLKGEGADIVELLIFSIALAVSVIPEALPLVTTFSLSRGALNLAKKRVVVKRLSAIEDLGSVEVLCADKTGTLTENQLTVAKVIAHNHGDPLFYACLASDISLEHLNTLNNSFDVALLNKLGSEQREKLAEYEKAGDLAFDPDRRRNSVTVKKDEAYELVSRGAAEDIIGLCHGMKQEDRDKYLKWQAEQGRAGRRIIAVAAKGVKRGDTDIKWQEHGMDFLGMISFVDPLKKSTIGAIIQARKLGVKIKILTGDSPEVAGAVATEIGLIDDPDDVMTGSELVAMPADEQKQAVKKIKVFARVTPLQKYKIIELLREQGATVGFLGEGINDAPALKIADVALVVQGAADIAREAADIVLLKKSLSVIINGISEGRVVFANTTKYIKTTLTSNFGNFYAVAIASLLIDYLPMLPLQILLLNLVSDMPMISVSTDRVDVEELKKPKGYQVRDIVLFATILGLISTICDFVFFALFSRIGPQVLQTNWFIGSILTELAIIYSIRTKFAFFRARRPSRTLVLLTILAALITVIIPYSGLGQQVFGFIRPSANHMIIILVVVVTYFVISEMVKLLYYKFFDNKNTQPKTI